MIESKNKGEAIAQVRQNKTTGQRYINIPKKLYAFFEKDDYVLINKIKLEVKRK